MSPEKDQSNWPPDSGKQFIRSDTFAQMLLFLVKGLASKYPKMDFSDAVAQVFTWFDKKLSHNSRFINRRRFPSVNAFEAYLRQCVWNSARLTERVRKRQQRLEALKVDEEIVAHETTTEELAILSEAVDLLSEPHKTIFCRLFFDEEDVHTIASILNRTQKEIIQLYEEAIDLLGEELL